VPGEGLPNGAFRMCFPSHVTTSNGSHSHHGIVGPCGMSMRTRLRPASVTGVHDLDEYGEEDGVPCCACALCARPQPAR